MPDFDDGIEREDEWDYLCEHADDGEGFGPDDEDDDLNDNSPQDEADAIDREPPLFVGGKAAA